MLSLSNKGLICFDSEIILTDKNVEIIDVSHNMLVRIKKSITNYVNLKELNCSHNQIKKISSHMVLSKTKKHF